MPGFFQRPVRQVHRFCAQFFRGLALLRVERRNAAVAEVTVRAGRNHGQIELAIHQGIGDRGGVLVIDLRVVVHLMLLDVVKQLRGDLIGHLIISGVPNLPPHSGLMSPGTNPPLPGLNVHRHILCKDFSAICDYSFNCFCNTSSHL
jgi:hypothetical protein